VQSNKTRQIAGHFHWVHSVDRVKIAQRLHEARPAHLPPLNICIQVNISHEPSKAGIAPADLPALITACCTLDRLRLRGLMALPEPRADFEKQRLPFRQLRQLLESVNSPDLNLDTLSMGTTTDMEAAIAEGATLLRVGTGVFGARH
jgi:pyridoxal phosphate enzyme (YggS family)